jgi:hypothetical protein
MRFILQPTNVSADFHLIYRNEEHSFDIEPFIGGGISSIMINYLQLEIDENGKILYVWGYCPLIKFEETNKFPKNYKFGKLFALLDEPIIPGISHRLNEEEAWPVYINKKRQWICLGNPEIDNKQLIQFAPNSIAVLENNTIIAIWLNPHFT